MSRIRGYCLALLFPFAANAVESNFPLYDMEPNLHDQASLQRGAATYMNYCLGCHSLGYQRYKRTAEDLGIPERLMLEYLVQDPNAKIGDLIGLSGQWVKVGYNNLFFSNARSMARYGLLALNEGTWENTPIINDKDYFFDMTNTSQELNPSYGYLWWLNGKESVRMPRSEVSYPTPLMENAPADLIAGLGANDQKLYVVPSQKLVVVRLGDDASESSLGPSSFDEQLWEKINALMGN